MKQTDSVLVLAYAGCQTCKNALKWLDASHIEYQVRPIVEQPPTPAELKAWVVKSKLPIRKWLNTSGQSYRALGKAKFDESTDTQIAGLLAADGKLVKRPVLVKGDSVVVGFRPEAYRELFG